MLRTYACALLLCFGWSAVAGSDDLEDINFPLNSSVVVDGFQGLDMLAAVMAKHPALDLEVVGHTDSLGSAEYNKRLSEKRAESVKTYLVSKGVRASQVKTSGEGIDRSFDNATREGRFQNRRVTLTLYETVDGVRSKVSYRRLLELFFGGDPAARMLELTEKQTLPNDKKILEKLTDLDRKVDQMGDRLSKRIDELETRYEKRSEETPQSASVQLKLDKYTGVSLAAGLWDVGDQDDFTGQIRGMYFRPVNENFALQAEVDFSYYDELTDGQFDAAAVYQKNGFKLAAAGSYKWVSINGLDTARIGQGAIVANFLFGSGKIGAYGSFPFADGDVVSTTPAGGAFVNEIYVNVPNQVGLDFGVSVGDRVDLSGYAASIDGETDADVGAGLKLDVLVGDQWSWFLQADMNEWILVDNDDGLRYLTGLRFGSWTQARYKVHDQLTPVDLPQLRYELLSRTRRTGNTAPIANAGPSRSDVAAGTVTLDGSNSADPEGDPLTFQWAQTSGPTVQIQNANQATATFEGVAGETYAFELTVADDRGDIGRDSVTIAMEAAAPEAPVIGTFLATPDTIVRGQFANLTWSTVNAAQVTISGVGAVPPSGSLLISPEQTTEYTLTASNEGGTVSQTVTVTVEEEVVPMPEINFFNATPSEVAQGESSVLTWSASFADEVTLSGFGRVGATGSLTVSPDATTEYTLTASNAEGSVTASVTVAVQATPEPVIEFFTAIPAEIQEGGFTTLSWSTSYADTVSISSLGQVGASGSLVLSPTETTTYTLTATNDSGTATASATVTVNPAVGENRPPVANAGPDQTLLFPGTVTLDGSGSFDPDNQTLTYQWQQLAGKPVQLNGANTAMPTFEATTSDYTFRLTVTDEGGLSATDEVTISVVSFKDRSER